MHTHEFYMALAYGISAVLLVAEVGLIFVRWRQAQRMQHAQERNRS